MRIEGADEYVEVLFVERDLEFCLVCGIDVRARLELAETGELRRGLPHGVIGAAVEARRLFGANGARRSDGRACWRRNRTARLRGCVLRDRDEGCKGCNNEAGHLFESGAVGLKRRVGQVVSAFGCAAVMSRFTGANTDDEPLQPSRYAAAGSATLVASCYYGSTLPGVSSSAPT